MPRYYRSEKEFEEFERGRLTQIWGPDYQKFGAVLDEIAVEVLRRDRSQEQKEKEKEEEE